MDSTRPGPLHRDLIRENNFTSFNSPSPVLGSESSVGDYVESPTSSENLPTLGLNTPPVQEIEDLEDDLGHLTLDQLGRERYVGKSSPMFYGRRHYGGQHSPEAEKPEALKFIENLDLPSPEVMTHLLNLHFTYVHPSAPVVVWSKFLKRLKGRDYTPSFLFLLNSIFALASRFSDDVSLRKNPAKPETVGVHFADKARKILDTLYDSPDIYCVGGLVLLAFQQMGTGNGYRSWMYVGISIRMAQHLGLNRNCQKLNPNMPIVDREERNRVWWTCFMGDRILAASFGRPQGINEHDVDATYPEGIDEENIQLEYRLEGAASMLTGPVPDSEKNFVHMASLMRILGRVMVSLYSPLSRASSKSTTSMTNPAPLEQLDKELTDWLLTLPPHLQFRSVQQESGTLVCTLHMMFYAVLILLHKPYSHRSSHITPNDPSISLSICTSAANNTIEMASNLMRAIDEKRGVSRLKDLLHHSVFIFFTAGVVHITNCTSTDPVLAASAKLRTIETLKCMAMVEDVWITGKWCANNLKQLLKARNIELPYSSEAFKCLPLGNVEDLKKKFGTGSAQLDLSIAASIPKEQSFAFDVDQIMGYYQGTDAKHHEPMGRNSRHFSPTPYFSPAAGNHHYHSQAPMKPHPGLTQGHSPLPRRPRQGKNTSPSPSSSVPSVPSSSASTPNNGFFPCLDSSAGTTTAYSINSNNSNANVNSSIDPFAAPGSATVTTPNLQQSPIQAEQKLNLYQNPFSSSLWGLPTSMDTDEWMLYMQNSGSDGENILNLGIDTQGNDDNNGNNTRPENPMFGPLTDINSGGMNQNHSVGMAANSTISNCSTPNRTHPLSQSMTSNDLLGGADQSGIINSPNTTRPLSSSIPAYTISMSEPSMSAAGQAPVSTASILSAHAQQHPVTSQALLTTQQPSDLFFLNGNLGMGTQPPQQQ
ncbi:hypothetical protein BGZ54_001257 [Gamsiella multidivaricata]|nr:hypothetical protein BGZ54_001257 [Gamsiella multidivaricata]